MGHGAKNLLVSVFQPCPWKESYPNHLPPPQPLYHHSLCKTWICSHYVIKKNRFQDIALSICLKVFFNFENKNPVSFHTSVPAIYVNRISSLSKVFISNCLVLRRRKV